MLGTTTAFVVAPGGPRFVAELLACADVDEAHEFLARIGARIIHAPRDDSFAPGYYSVLFEDPDGTRLEINHVPGKGLLEPGTPIGGGYADGSQNG